MRRHPVSSPCFAVVGFGSLEAGKAHKAICMGPFALQVNSCTALVHLLCLYLLSLLHSTCLRFLQPSRAAFGIRKESDDLVQVDVRQRVRGREVRGSEWCLRGEISGAGSRFANRKAHGFSHGLASAATGIHSKKSTLHLRLMGEAFKSSGHAFMEAGSLALDCSDHGIAHTTGHVRGSFDSAHGGHDEGDAKRVWKRRIGGECERGNGGREVSVSVRWSVATYDGR